MGSGRGRTRRSQVASSGQKVTLESFFAELHGQHYESARSFEAAVYEAFNRYITEWPVGFKCKEAIDAAITKGWVTASGAGLHPPGIRIEVPWLVTQPSLRIPADDVSRVSF